MIKHVIKKRDRYMTGHNYATGLGYKFHWTKDLAEARKWETGELAAAQEMARKAKGRVVDHNFVEPMDTLLQEALERLVVLEDDSGLVDRIGDCLQERLFSDAYQVSRRVY